MKKKYDDGRQIKITFTSADAEKMLDDIDKLQTEISDIKQLLGSIHANLKVLTVEVKSLRIAVDKLPKDKN